MSFLDKLRSSMRADAPEGATSEPDPAAGDDAVTARYRKLNERQAIAALGPLTQVELTAIERFERTHRDRVSVLDKLRYLREPEPMPGYDALDPKAISEALAEADTDTVKSIREYERKHENRTTVNTEVASTLHRLRDRAATGNGLPIKVEPERGLGTL